MFWKVNLHCQGALMLLFIEFHHSHHLLSGRIINFSNSLLAFLESIGVNITQRTFKSNNISDNSKFWNSNSKMTNSHGIWWKLHWVEEFTSIKLEQCLWSCWWPYWCWDLFFSVFDPNFLLKTFSQRCLQKYDWEPY